jgi:hypothetical protein
MMTAPAVSTAVVAVPMLDLNHSTIRRCHRGNAHPGGSGSAHRQRSKQRSSNQNEASHPSFSPSRNRDEAQVPDEWICSAVVKLIVQRILAQRLRDRHAKMAMEIFGKKWQVGPLMIYRERAE